jgi:hypothetical protein
MPGKYLCPGYASFTIGSALIRFARYAATEKHTEFFGVRLSWSPVGAKN